MKTVNLLGALRKYPLFTTNDLSRMLMKSEDYVKVVAYRLRKQGLIKQVERGKYTVHDDATEFASYIVVPSYISFWTALSIYQLTEQLPRDVMVAVPKPKREITFNSQKITFTKLSHFWGYMKIRHRDFDMLIAEKEKAVIDCLLAKNTPFDEPAKAVASGELDYERLMEYTKRTKNSSLAKRIGYLIEKSGRDASQILDMIDSNYIPLDWAAKSSGKKDFRWKIIVNRKLEE